MNGILFLILSLELCTLAWHRGINVHGWELLGVADAAWGIYHKGLWPTVVQYASQTQSYQYWDSTNSGVFAFTAGMLDNVMPWLYWSQAVMLSSSLVAAWGLRKALKLPTGMFLACLAASPLLLCFSLVGFPYMSGAFPYVATLAIVYREKPLKWYIEIPAWVLLFFFTFCCYEIGRMALFVTVIAAVTLPMRWYRRGGYLSIAGFWWYEFCIAHGQNLTNRFNDFGLKLSRAWYYVGIYIDGVWSWHLDMPWLLFAGVVGVFTIKRHRVFWAGVYAVIWAMVVLNIINGANDALIARRYILVNMFSVVMVCLAWKDAEEGEKQVLYGWTFLGTVCTMLAIMNFVAKPVGETGLPFISSVIDFKLQHITVEKAQDIVDKAKFIPLQEIDYDNDVYVENTTDPQGLPERVLLQLGPKAFEQHIRFIGKERCRYSCLPFYERRVNDE